MKIIEFDENTIQRLFGHEAAEDEEPSRLREYYFKARTYQQIANDLSLRILVGHKGIGKSALFKVAQAEDEENKILALSIQLNDLVGIASGNAGFLDLIREWREGLVSIIAQKALTSLGMESEDVVAKLKRFGGQLIDFLAETFQQRAKVNFTGSKKLILDNFLKTHKICIYIDDLDRGWQGRKEDIIRISALLNAVRDIINDMRGVRFRIALRSDVYFLVRTSDESTDKIEGSVVWQSFTNHEILALLVKRVKTFFGEQADESMLISYNQRILAQNLHIIMTSHFEGQGHWENAPMHRVLMSLIRKRPRDLVKLCTLAARQAYSDSSSKIRTAHFERVFEEYSQGRIQDTVNEFRSELPGIERLIMNMKPTRKERTTKEGYVYTTDALIQKIKNILQGGKFVFANGKDADPKDLIQFLYKINFLTGRKETDAGIVRKYFEENRYIYSSSVDFGFAWEIHPAYRWALQPDDPKAIFRELELSVD